MAKLKEEKQESVQPIVLGKTNITVAGVLRLREITEDEALVEFARMGDEPKIINAWKRANGKK